MWILQSQLDEDTVYTLIPGKEYIVGRKDCDIVIDNDKSISRKHATLSVIYSENDVEIAEISSKCLVNDSSKYGVSVNKVKIDKTEPFEVKDGDLIKFGALKSDWVIKQKQLLVTTSSVKNKTEIKSLLAKLGGHLTSDWQEGTTHLLMPTLLLTVKAVCALVSAKPIVTPAYLEELLKSCKNNSGIPSVREYLPSLAEPILQDLEVDFSQLNERKEVFQGKKFLFSSAKQHKKLEMPIKLGKGKAILLSSLPRNNVLLEDGVCVVAVTPNVNTPSPTTSWIPKALNTLQRNSKRIIPESEIGMAVLYHSTEKYCNADYDLAATADPLSMPSQSQS